MSLENVTKEIFDKLYKESLTITEEELQKALDLVKDISSSYQQQLQVRAKYRTDYQENRIIHQVDFDKGIIQYKIQGKRKIGFQIPYTRNDNEKDNDLGK